MKINGDTKIIGIFGHPVEHSISPVMHNAAFEFLNLNYAYVAFPVKPQDLKSALAGAKALNIVGLNITVPHKEKVIPFLDDITDAAKLIGAVNTIHHYNGKLVGYNTDGPGFVDSLRLDAGVEPDKKRAVIIGAGGAARAVTVALAQAGIKEIMIADIDKHKAAKLAKDLIKKMKIAATTIDPETLKLDNCDILINATPMGMYPKINDCPLSEKVTIPDSLIVCDLVYTPAETLLMQRAKKAGARTLGGAGMLIRQGALAFSIFTNQEAPVEVMRKAALEALQIR